MRSGSLCTGYGGLDPAVEQHFGAATAWTCDIDPGASRIITERFPHAPNLHDITRIDWSRVEPVDVISTGWPCQPFSLAGKRKGANDDRALWPEVARAVRALRPRYVVLENVAAIAAVGELARAVGSLAALGYVGSWRCLRAADVGAPHGRARIFIVASNTDYERQQRGGGARDGRRRSQDSSKPATHSESNGWHEGRAESAGELRGFDAAECSPDALADANGDGRARLRGQQANGCDVDRRSSQDTAWRDYEPAIRRWEQIIGRPAPAPTTLGPRGRRLNPVFSEWMMGLPEGWVTDVPGLSRSAQLTALGNGVVPQQALAALQIMHRV